MTWAGRQVDEQTTDTLTDDRQIASRAVDRQTDDRQALILSPHLALTLILKFGI